jgi:quercetin dioxygenase-like cupin family protein
MVRALKIVIAILWTASLIGASYAQDAGRTELKRADLTGTNMEIVISVVEYKPGDIGTRHIHHGEEAFYILQGATLELPDGRQTTAVEGNANINARDMPHGAFKVVGDKSFKLLTVHVVDKGQPLYDTPK